MLNYEVRPSSTQMNGRADKAWRMYRRENPWALRGKKSFKNHQDGGECRSKTVRGTHLTYSAGDVESYSTVQSEAEKMLL